MSVYGIGKSHSTQEWRDLIRTLLHQGLLRRRKTATRCWSSTQKAGEVLRDQRTVQISEAVARPPAKCRGAAPASPAAASAEGRELFETLRALRKRLADAQGMPPYVIFHDATLREIAERRPVTLGEFAGIRGVGEAKLARYGEEFVALVRGHAT